MLLTTSILEARFVIWRRVMKQWFSSVFEHQLPAVLFAIRH
jgi:hypothetical protein